MNYDDVAMNSAIEYLRQAKEKLWGTGIDGSDLEEEGLAAKAAIEAKISDAEASLAGIDTNISLESTTIPSFGAALDSGIVGTSVEDFSFEKLTPEMQESVKDTLAETGNITDIQEEKILNSSNNSLAIAFLLAIVLNNETIHALEGQDGPVSYYRIQLAEIEYIKKADPERYENELELIEQEFYNQCVEILGEPENGETYTYEWITSYIERLKNENASYTGIIKISAYDYLTDADISSIEDISLTELNIVASNEQSISENIVYYLNASRDDYNNWNYTNILYYLNEYGIGEEEVPWGIVLYHILNDTEFREWYKGEYGEELTEDNLVAFFGMNDKTNDDVSLQLRAFRYMTEEEKANYNYLIQTEGLCVANDYLNALEQFINERYGMDLGYQQFIDIINTEGGFSKMWLRFWDGYSVGGETFLNNIATTFNGNTTKTVAANESEYSQLFLLTYTQPISKEDIETMHSDGNLTDEVYDKLISMENPTLLDKGYLTGDINIDENIYEEYLDIKETEEFQEYQEYIDTGINAQLLSGFYSVGNTIGYMTPMIFATAATTAVGGGFGLSSATSMTMGKYVGGGFNFLASYGSNYSKNIQSGHPRGGAMLAALLAASSEATLEYRLGRIAGLSKSDDIVDFAHDVCKSLNIQQIVLTWGRKVGSQITGEIKEELLQDLAVKMIDSTILGEPITLSIDETFDIAILTVFTTLLLNAPSNTLNLGVDIYNNSHTLFSVNLGNGQQLSLSYMDLNTFYDADTGFFDLGALKADIESKTGLELGGTDVSKVQITDPTIAITPTDSTIATPPTISEQQSSRIQNVMKEMDLRLGNGKGLELLTRYAETGDISEISAVGFRENLLDISFDSLSNYLNSTANQENVSVGLEPSEVDVYITATQELIDSSNVDVSQDVIIDTLMKNYDISFDQANYILEQAVDIRKKELLIKFRSLVAQESSKFQSDSSIVDFICEKKKKKINSYNIITLNALQRFVEIKTVGSSKTMNISNQRDHANIMGIKLTQDTIDNLETGMGTFFHEFGHFLTQNGSAFDVDIDKINAIISKTGEMVQKNWASIRQVIMERKRVINQNISDRFIEKYGMPPEQYETVIIDRYKTEITQDRIDQLLTLHAERLKKLNYSDEAISNMIENCRKNNTEYLATQIGLAEAHVLYEEIQYLETCKDNFYCAFSDIVSACIGGNKILFEGKYDKLGWAHTAEYYLKSNVERLQEICAEYSRLCMMGDKAGLEIIRSTFGDELFLEIEKIFNTSIRSNTEQGSILSTLGSTPMLENSLFDFLSGTIPGETLVDTRRYLQDLISDSGISTNKFESWLASLSVEDMQKIEEIYKIDEEIQSAKRKSEYVGETIHYAYSKYQQPVINSEVKSFLREGLEKLGITINQESFENFVGSLNQEQIEMLTRDFYGNTSGYSRNNLNLIEDMYKNYTPTTIPTSLRQELLEILKTEDGKFDQNRFNSWLSSLSQEEVDSISKAINNNKTLLDQQESNDALKDALIVSYEEYVPVETEVSQDILATEDIIINSDGSCDIKILDGKVGIHVSYEEAKVYEMFLGSDWIKVLSNSSYEQLQQIVHGFSDIQKFATQQLETPTESFIEDIGTEIVQDIPTTGNIVQNNDGSYEIKYGEEIIEISQEEAILSERIFGDNWANELSTAGSEKVKEVLDIYKQLGTDIDQMETAALEKITETIDTQQDTPLVEEITGEVIQNNDGSYEIKYGEEIIDISQEEAILSERIFGDNWANKLSTAGSEKVKEVLDIYKHYTEEFEQIETEVLKNVETIDTQQQDISSVEDIDVILEDTPLKEVDTEILEDTPVVDVEPNHVSIPSELREYLYDEISDKVGHTSNVDSWIDSLTEEQIDSIKKRYYATEEILGSHHDFALGSSAYSEYIEAATERSSLSNNIVEMYSNYKPNNTESTDFSNQSSNNAANSNSVNNSSHIEFL